MTDELPPDVQATLRAQAIKLCAAIANEAGSINGDLVVAAKSLFAAYRLGQSTERARQQGLIAKWRARQQSYRDHPLYTPSKPEEYLRLTARIAEIGECADELEAGQ